MIINSFCTQKPQSLIKDLEETYNAKNTSRLLNLFTDDVSLELKDVLTAKGRREIQKIVEYLFVLDSHIHFSRVQKSNQIITGDMAESNKSLIKSGMGKIRFFFRFRLDGKQINSICLEMTMETAEEFAHFFNELQLWIARERQRYLSWVMKDSLKITSPSELGEWCSLLEEWLDAGGDKNIGKDFSSVMTAVGFKEGMIIADVGAGDGSYSYQLSRRVGNTGKIYSTDIEKKRLRKIRQHCTDEKITNIFTSLGEETDARLPEDRFDMIFLRHTLHCMSEPAVWLKSLVRYIQPDTRLVIIDGDPDILGYGWDYENKKEEVIQMAEEAGFLLERLETFLLPDDYIYIFRLSPTGPLSRIHNILSAIDLNANLYFSGSNFNYFNTYFPCFYLTGQY